MLIKDSFITLVKQVAPFFFFFFKEPFTVASQWRRCFLTASIRLWCSEAQWFNAQVVALISLFSLMCPLSSFWFRSFHASPGSVLNKKPTMNATMQRSVHSSFYSSSFSWLIRSVICFTEYQFACLSTLLLVCLPCPNAVPILNTHLIYQVCIRPRYWHHQERHNSQFWRLQVHQVSWRSEANQKSCGFRFMVTKGVCVFVAVQTANAAD